MKHQHSHLDVVRRYDFSITLVITSTSNSNNSRIHIPLSFPTSVSIVWRDGRMFGAWQDYQHTHEKGGGREREVELHREKWKDRVQTQNGVRFRAFHLPFRSCSRTALSIAVSVLEALFGEEVGEGPQAFLARRKKLLHRCEGVGRGGAR